MKPFILRLVGKALLLIGCVLVTFQYASAQAPAKVYLVSTDDNDKICAGETITFIATPTKAPSNAVKYIYKFYRIGNSNPIVNDPDDPNDPNDFIEIVDTNRYTTNKTQANFKVKVVIEADPDGDNPSEESNTVEIIVFSVPKIEIKQLSDDGNTTSAIPPQVLSTNPDIKLTAVSVPLGEGPTEGPIPIDLTKGFFSGEGVKKSGPDYIFSPSFVGAGRYNITYTYTHNTNDNSCVVTVQQPIIVNATSGAIKGLAPYYCVKNEESSVSLNFDNEDVPNQCGEYYCYSYKITYNLISITGKGILPGFKFNPQKAWNAGDKSKTDVSIGYTVTYEYKYTYPFIEDYTFTTEMITVTESVNLYTIDKLEITNSGQIIKPDTFFCRNYPLILTGIPSSLAGQFRIKKPNISDPEIGGATYPFLWENDTINYPKGEYEITYTYTNPNGCASEPKVIRFTLLDVPAIPSFSRLEYNYCVGETIANLEPKAAPAPGLTTRWRIGDINATPTDTSSFNPKVNNTFDNAVKIYVTQYNGTCESPVVTLTIRVSPQPDANFAYKNVCQGDTTQFKDETDPKNNTILRKVWDFGDGDILPEGIGNIPDTTHGGRTKGTYENPKHIYQNPGTYQVTLSLVTSACPDSETRPVYIFPVKDAFPYLETFETGPGGWLSKSDISTSWKLIQPTGSTIIPDPSSPNAWITSNDVNSYNSPENSFVESPCFILEKTRKPFVSVNIRSDIEEGLDGAVLQYVIDDGSKFDDELQWKVLGNSNQGINWYNASGIVSNPGGQSIALPVGWSGMIQDDTKENRWITAKFNLAQVRQEAGINPVRFRIAFSSNRDNPPNRSFDGFAFDNFIIGEINRTVLLEHFTNSSEPGNIEETQKIYQALPGNDIAVIQYHTSFPTPDPINDDNESDPSARALLYGIAKTNSTVLDGLPPNHGNEHKPFSEAGWGNDRYSQRILFEAPFNIDIQLTTESENGPLQIQAILSKNNTLKDFDNPIIVQTAIVEKSLVSEAATFQNVLRKLLPDAAGKRLSGKWKASEETRTESIFNSWQPKSVEAAPNTFAVIVFLQDENTKEIYQVKEQIITIPIKADPSSDRNGIATGEPDDFDEKSISIFPNPASHHVNISFGKATESERILVVYDALGKSVYTKNISKGAKEHMLSTENYSPGIYVVHLATSGNLKIFRKKLVIVR